MARAFVVPIRSDCPGAGVQVLDLVPNTSQKNSIYDGPGQTFYLRGADSPWATTVNGDAYVAGSRMTILTVANDATVQDTTGGGNDCRATAIATFGLAAYLQERIQPGGIVDATAGRLAPANAQLLTWAIMNRVYNAQNIAAADIRTLLSDVAVGGTANTDLDGTHGFSNSFGSVEDILRILSGEVYGVPRYTVITGIAGGPTYPFMSLADRTILVAAQITAVTGKTFVEHGHFLARDEHGFIDIPLIAATGEVTASAHEGHLHKLYQSTTFKNPNYAYTLALTTQTCLPAIQWNGIFVPATGSAPVVVAYFDDGVCVTI